MTTTLDDIKKAVDALEQRVSKLEKAPRGGTVDKALRDRVEDLCDFAYGRNVRPQPTERGEDDYPALVKPSNEDDEES